MAPCSLPAAERYYKESLSRLETLLDAQRAPLDRAASLCTEAIAHEGLVHLFGSAAYGRQGTLYQGVTDGGPIAGQTLSDCRRNDRSGPGDGAAVSRRRGQARHFRSVGRQRRRRGRSTAKLGHAAL